MNPTSRITHRATPLRRQRGGAIYTLLVASAGVALGMHLAGSPEDRALVGQFQGLASQFASQATSLAAGAFAERAGASVAAGMAGIATPKAEPGAAAAALPGLWRAAGAAGDGLAAELLLKTDGTFVKSIRPSGSEARGAVGAPIASGRWEMRGRTLVLTAADGDVERLAVKPSGADDMAMLANTATAETYLPAGTGRPSTAARAPAAVAQRGQPF